MRWEIEGCEMCGVQRHPLVVEIVSAEHLPWSGVDSTTLCPSGLITGTKS